MDNIIVHLKALLDELWKGVQQSGSVQNYRREHTRFVHVSVVE